MHFCLKLGILPFKVIADLIGLYLVAFQNNTDSDMGNAFQACFFTAGLNVLLQCAVCPQFLCPAQVVRFRACNVCDPGFFFIGYGIRLARPGSIIHCILKPCSYIFVDEISYCVRVDTGCLRYLSVGHSICAIKDNFCALYLTVFRSLGSSNFFQNLAVAIFQYDVSVFFVSARSSVLQIGWYNHYNKYVILEIDYIPSGI